MIKLRHRQPTLWAGFLAEEVEDLWEPWMKAADKLLEDENLLERVYEAQGVRHPRSRNLGRTQTPAEVVLRLLVLKHVRNWSYQTLEREVRANLVYRTFTRIGTEKVPDAKTMGRLGQVLGPEVISDLHARVVALAQQNKVVRGCKLRVDTTVVESNIHYPTDSSLLGDGARVLTRTMKKMTETVGELGVSVRDRMRSVRHRAMEIARASRWKGEEGERKRSGSYRRLLSVTRKVVNQAIKVVQAVRKKHQRLSRRDQLRIEALRQQLETMIPRVKQVLRQTKARLFEGTTHYPGKLVSIFEPETEIIRKGKANKPTEFGKLVKVQEAENHVITHFEVYAQRPSDSDLLVPSVQAHRRRLGRVPHLVAADAGFYSQQNERAVQEMGVPRVSIPNHATRSSERKRHQKQRWFRKGQRWRTGSEGRISVLKRRHGLSRCRYRGYRGMQRWVGLGVIADNLINIGRRLAPS